MENIANIVGTAIVFSILACLIAVYIDTRRNKKAEDRWEALLKKVAEKYNIDETELENELPKDGLYGTELEKVYDYDELEIHFENAAKQVLAKQEQESQEEKEKPKKASPPKSEEVDIEKELEKLKGLLDKGLITQEQYDAKSNELLGL